MLLLLALLAIAPPASFALSSPASEGIVTGAASAEAQAEFSAAEGTWGGSRRTLLHGKRRPSSYTVCPVCTAISCVAGGLCSGHCKRSRTLFTCKISGRVANDCATPEDLRPDPTTLPPDALPEVASAWVMVTAPYVGCANVSNAADGCPDAGTTGTLNGEGVTVLESSCTQHLYDPPCPLSKQEPPTQFYPFGYCFCLLKFDSGKVAGGPCRLSYLDWSGPAGGEDAVPVQVAPDGAVTRTKFGVTEEADVEEARTYTLQHKFISQAGPIDAELWIIRRFTSGGFDIVAEGPLPGAEEEEEEEEEESALGKFLRGFTPK